MYKGRAGAPYNIFLPRLHHLCTERDLCEDGESQTCLDGQNVEYNSYIISGSLHHQIVVRLLFVDAKSKDLPGLQRNQDFLANNHLTPKNMIVVGLKFKLNQVADGTFYFLCSLLEVHLFNFKQRQGRCLYCTCLSNK